MNTTSHKRLYGLSLASITVALAGCFGGSSTPPPDVIVPPPAAAAQPVALQALVKNAATGLPVTLTAPDKVTLVVYGADAAKIVDANGVSLYSAANGFAGPVSAASGFFTVYLKPGTPVPSQMSVRLVASAKGFVNSSADLVIKSTDLKTDGSTTGIDVNIALVNQTAPPPSVTVVSTPITVTNGTTAAVISTNKTPESTAVVNGATVSLGSATVVVPATTVIYADAAKTIPLPAGTTAVNVTYNNNTTASSLATFPGGFQVSQSATGTALAAPAAFISGGFASIEVASTAANGTVTLAKTFDKPLSVTIPIPKATINPQTGLAVKAGDSIPIFSYDTTTGAWTALKLTNGTLVTGTLGALDTSNNTFPVVFATDHLTYMSPGWVTAADQQCSDAAITVVGASGRALELAAVRMGNGWYDVWRLDSDTAAPASQLSNIGTAPRNTPVELSALQNGVFVGSRIVPDLCASGITLTVTPATPPVVAVNVLVRDVCSNSTASPAPSTLRPGVSVNAFNAASGNESVMTGTNGVATFPLIVGSTYTIAVPDPFNYSQPYTVLSTTNSIAVDRAVTCQVVSGS